jgi:predicted dehydrogenase
MKQPVKVALVGIAGYGQAYVNQVLDLPKEAGVVPVGAIARRPERCSRLADLQARGAAVCGTIEDFFAHHRADLVIISSPIHLHGAHTALALHHGANVLCEKPIAPTVQDARSMQDAEKRSGRFVAIGYQWSFTGAIQSLKRDIVSGVLGRPIRFKSLTCWPRTVAYYRRNDWAGKLKTADGQWILDSPIMNATAHYLHNMLYLLGAEPLSSARPAQVIAELYRANEIENYDTGAIRCTLENGVEVLMYSSHAVRSELGPIGHGEFEKADVYYCRYDRRGSQWIARFRDGSVKAYGDPNDIGPRLLRTVDSVRTGTPVLCGIDAALPHLICVNSAQESAGEVHTVPAEFVHTDGEGDSRQYSVQGLEETLVQCYNLGLLPSEYGAVPWSRPGRPIDVRSYPEFPRGTHP